MVIAGSWSDLEELCLGAFGFLLYVSKPAGFRSEIAGPEALSFKTFFPFISTANNPATLVYRGFFCFFSDFDVRN